MISKLVTEVYGIYTTIYLDDYYGEKEKSKIHM